MFSLVIISSGCLFAQHKIAPANSAQAPLITRYVRYAEDSVPLPVIPKILYDKSIASMSFTGVKQIKSKEPKHYTKFNPKKDDITDVVVRKHYGSDGYEYEFTVVHHNGKECDMNEFSVRIEGDNLVYREGTGLYDYYDVNGSIKDYLDGTLSKEGDIVITHIQSNTSTKIHYEFLFRSSMNLPGRDAAYLFEPVRSNVFENVYAILDLQSSDYAVVKGPFLLNTDGRDGKDGRNGYNGNNGLNERDWTDKNGKTHHSNGTCGTPGGNGGNGENGQDGGNSFVFVGPGTGTSLRVSYAGGKGGKGGRGGVGGKHGKGASCIGTKASDGYPGRDGSPGRIGSVQYEYAKYADIMGMFSNQYQMKKMYCSIVVNKSTKKKKSKDQPKDSGKYSEDAVEF